MQTRLSDLISVAEAATLLQVSQSTIWRWVRSGALPAYRIGQRRIRVQKADAEQLITPARGPENGERDRATDEAKRLERWGIRPLTDEEQRRALKAVEAARHLMARILAERGGELFSDSAEVLRELREERSKHLDDLHNI